MERVEKMKLNEKPNFLYNNFLIERKRKEWGEDGGRGKMEEKGRYD